MTVEATLAERGKRYGAFDEHAKISQCLKDVMRHAPKWRDLWPDQIEALEMIQHKIGRILNGDPNYADSWHDIAGYAKLVEDRLTAKSTAAPSNGVVPCEGRTCERREDGRQLLALPSLTESVKKAARKRRGA